MQVRDGERQRLHEASHKECDGKKHRCSVCGCFAKTAQNRSVHEIKSHGFQRFQADRFRKEAVTIMKVISPIIFCPFYPFILEPVAQFFQCGKQTDRRSNNRPKISCSRTRRRSDVGRVDGRRRSECAQNALEGHSAFLGRLLSSSHFRIRSIAKFAD